MKKTILILSCLTALTAGCASMNQYYVSDNGPEAQKAKAVELFYADRPTRPYKAIGRVNVQRYGDFKGMIGIPRTSQEIDDALKLRAAVQGGDAIIDINEIMGEINGVLIKYK